MRSMGLLHSKRRRGGVDRISPFPAYIPASGRTTKKRIVRKRKSAQNTDKSSEKAVNKPLEKKISIESFNEQNELRRKRRSRSVDSMLTTTLGYRLFYL